MEISLVLEKDWLSNSTEKINPTPLLIPTTMIILLYHMSSVFLKSLCNFFKNILNIKLSFFGINKLSSIIRVQKDPLSPLSHSNVVYKLRCAQCDASYMGQNT